MNEADDLRTWQQHRRMLLGVAYRMLGDLARAEDVLQDAWLRYRGRTSKAEDPRAYLLALVTRSCLNELGSARARREESRGNRLPEPIDLSAAGLERLEAVERISLAFVVLLQRLTPAERAVLLLHEVFDYDHASIATLVGKSAPACRKLLERARSHVAAERRILEASPQEHARLLDAFVAAATSGDISGMVALLADDAVLVTDGGEAGRRAAGVRNLPGPLCGPAGIAAFVTAVTGRVVGDLSSERRELNGRPALVLFAGDAPFAALLLGVAQGRIHRVYLQADPERLRRFARTVS